MACLSTWFDGASTPSKSNSGSTGFLRNQAQAGMRQGCSRPHHQGGAHGGWAPLSLQGPGEKRRFRKLPVEKGENSLHALLGPFSFCRSQRGGFTELSAGDGATWDDTKPLIHFSNLTTKTDVDEIARLFIAQLHTFDSATAAVTIVRLVVILS